MVGLSRNYQPLPNEQGAGLDKGQSLPDLQNLCGMCGDLQNNDKTWLVALKAASEEMKSAEHAACMAEASMDPDFHRLIKVDSSETSSMDLQDGR